jgi:two-component system response regulator TctD
VTIDEPIEILLVEDNPFDVELALRAFEKSNIANRIEVARDGEEALARLFGENGDGPGHPPRMMLLDLKLPKIDGIEVLRRLRGRGDNVPVLILTADNSIASRVTGLDSGADDYLAKPFDIHELEARVRAQLRRAHQQKSPLVEFGSLAFDSNSRRFTLKGEELALTPRERAVLEMLISRLDRPVGKQALAQAVFGFDEDTSPNAIEIYVHRVRKKLEASDIGIVTMRGLGYVLRRSDAV